MKDFSYMFYPGDVLRDTQFFTDAQKGCYLSILCCHIENIPISYDLLMIITRCLSDYEKTSFLKIFDKDDEGYFLNWAVNSIEKRSEYLKSRSNNKSGRKKNEEIIEDENEIITQSYDLHMVNVNENKKEKVIKSELENVFNDFLEMRKKIKKPATPRAIELLKTRIKQFAKGDEQLAIKIIEQSILNSWQNVFELKQDYKIKTQQTQKHEMGDALKESLIFQLNKIKAQ